MSRQNRLAALSFAVFLALLAAAVMPLAALAQDEVPPQPDAPVVVVEDEPIGDEPVAITEEPTNEEPETEEISVLEVLEQLPEDTALVILDEEGQVLPLVTTEAAEAVASGDPYFWNGTEYVGFTTTSCPAVVGTCNVVAANPIQEAVNAFQTTVTATGDIFVESGNYTGSVIINGTLGNLGNLTGVIGAGSSLTTLNGSFNISNMNIFTLSGFIVTNDDGDAIYITNNTGALQLTDLEVTNTSVEATGIRVENHTGNVDLTNVSSTSFGNGIEIDVISGDVTLNNVTASGNSFGGANVYTENGSVAVNGGDFSNNDRTGLNINANGNITLDDVTATENGSSGVGVFVDSGNVSLTNVISTDNDDNGAYVSTTNGSIDVNGGDFSNNQDGLDARTDSGNVTLNNVNSLGNDFKGVYVWTPGAILVNGGDFSNNGGWGLYLSSSSGVITMENVTAIGNLNGARLGASDVEVICGSYSDNAEYGLVLSGGTSNLGGPILTGNGLGQYNLVGGTVSFGPCKKATLGNKQSGNGGEEGNNLSGEPPVCNGEKKVSLQPGDGFVFFENLCGLDFQLEEVKANVLPGVLPGGFSYIAGMDVGVSSGGQVVEELPVGGKITLKFPIPDGADEASLAVFFWNGSAWVEVPGGRIVDGFYVVEVNQPGIYVLAS